MKNIAIIGSTGAVGQELLNILEKRNFPVGNMILLASKRSVGKIQKFKDQSILVEELKEDSFQKTKIDIAFFASSTDISLKYIPLAQKVGTISIDNSSAYRIDASTPLIIPEINSESIKEHKGIIANPNCSTIIMLMAVYPIYKKNPIQKIIVSTYQAASGAGLLAMEELEKQTLAYLEKKEITKNIFKHQIAFNAFSHDSNINIESGYNGEEAKMIQETHKILNDFEIQIYPTCIRIPTLRAHAESIYISLKEETSIEVLQEALKNNIGLEYLDNREKNYFPMPIETSEKDNVYVGRLRKASSKNGKEWQLWCCGDQILKGAALNAVQIAELIL